MTSVLDRKPQDRASAVAELEAELADFSHDGLTLLLQHLGEDRVLRGSWAGCVISYKRGAAGSARCDRRGRARNAFTTHWDSGWLSEEEVQRYVEAELARRRVRPARSTSRPDVAHSGSPA
jgi:hypothetical protein